MSLRGLLYLLVATLACACATSLPYATDYPLSRETFRSRDGRFGGIVPQGWFSSGIDDSLAPALVVWLTKDDFSATVTIHEVHLDQLATKQIEEKGLKLLASITGRMQNGRMTGAATEPKEFELRGRKLCAYEFPTSEGRERVVVFGFRGNYYECDAASIKGSWTAEDFARLFSAQQTILASLSS